VPEDESDNDNAKAAQEPAINLDAHRGMRAQRETDRRRHRSAARADQDAVRANQASLERQLFAGPATDWPQVAEKVSYLLRLFAATGEGRDPRYRQLIEDSLRDLRRLTDDAKEPRR
jgi:hypothetical protein